MTQGTGNRELSERLLQVVEFAADGLTDKEIARRMGVSTSTVDFHWRRLRAMYDQGTRTGIVVHVLRLQHKVGAPAPA
jgi:DNA-binding NarL/FixJ family response regulator